MHAEDQLAAGDVLELVDEVAVAVARGDPLALEEAERVRAGRADAQSRLARDLGHVRAQLQQLALDVAGVPADRRRDLEHRLHQLGVDPRLELVAGDRLQHRVDVLDEVERLRRRGACTPPRRRACTDRTRPNLWSSTLPPCDGALAGDRVGIDLLHRRQPHPASTSTRQRVSSRPLMTIAGRRRPDRRRRPRRGRGRPPASRRRGR